MKLTLKTILFSFCLISSIFSCNEKQKEAEVDSDTFNIEELNNSPAAGEKFLKSYGDYLRSTIEIYNLKDSIIDTYSKKKSKFDNLNQTVEFEFDYQTNKYKYFVLNNLAKIHDLNDMKIVWNLNEGSFWSGLFSKNISRKEFTEFKNDKIYSIGEYSEYSELPIGKEIIMVIWHFRWKKLIINFRQIIDTEQKDQYIQKNYDNFEKIKKVYNTFNQNKLTKK